VFDRDFFYKLLCTYVYDKNYGLQLFFKPKLASAGDPQLK